MFRNYLKIALRNILKNKGYSFINICGLASGIAVAMLIGLWIWDELSFDKYHKNYKEIAQVMQNETFSGQVNTNRGVPIPLAAELKSAYGSNFKEIVLSSWTMNSMISFGDKKINTMGNFMDQAAPDVFSLQLIKGSAGAFKEPSSILLSESLARQLFGDSDPIGKLVKIQAELNEKVAGVYQDLPLNTSLHDMAFIAPFWDLKGWTEGQEHNWDNSSFQIFVQLADHVKMTDLSSKIKDIKHNKVNSDNAKYKADVFLFPMDKWHLYSEFKDGRNVGGGIQYIWMFSLIAAFVLLLACINFMNLSTARSEKRAKEVGIRKAIGSLRVELIGQFFGESLLVTFISFVVSILLLQLMMPFFNEVSGKQLSILWTDPIFWIMGIGFSLLTGMIAGLYPALYLSSFNPIKVLKGTFKAGPSASIPRKVLVVTQFAVSVALIIGTVVVFRQVQFSRSRPVGYSREGLVTTVMQTMALHDHFAALRQDLLKSGAVTEIAESNSPVTESDHYGNGFKWDGMDPNAPQRFDMIGVTAGYGKAIGLQIVDGRDFSEKMGSDSSSFILNEAAVKYMGIKDPVGKTIFRYGRQFRIIGIARDMVMGSPYSPAAQAVFYLDNSIGGILNIRLNPAMSIHDALEKIAAAYKFYSPEEPFSYKFADEEYARKFASEERIGKLAGFFAILATLISCLGLFGLASFMAEQRMKEIGVRKVFGASVFNVWALLSREFVKLILISFVVSMPIAYYFMHSWLQQFPYRPEITWWIFVLAGTGALFITLATVSYQSVKAALMNPIKSLRTE